MSAHDPGAPGLEVDPGTLAAAAARHDEAARAVADTLAALRAELGRLGNPLGDDEQGRTAAAHLAPATGDGLAAIGREAEALRALGDGLRSAAAAYRDLDDRAAGPSAPGPPSARPGP